MNRAKKHCPIDKYASHVMALKWVPIVFYYLREGYF